MAKRKSESEDLGGGNEPAEASAAEAATFVRVIRTQGAATLIEWDEAGDLRRSVVPAESVRVDECGCSYHEQPGAGVAYGLDWNRLIVLTATAADIGRALRARGIWTKEDARRDPESVTAAIREAHALDYQALSAAIEREG